MLNVENLCVVENIFHCNRLIICIKFANLYRKIFSAEFMDNLQETVYWVITGPNMFYCHNKHFVEWPDRALRYVNDFPTKLPTVLLFCVLIKINMH